MKNIICYKGRPITELSREELIEALTISMQQSERLREEKKHERDFIFLLKGFNPATPYQ
jgi:hypothetical protein